ncbi:MAG: O-antigen ligase family protein [Clostridia bacterium]|nr:O-antigen ligase family protein [Clostridia bacterium]
MLNSCSKPTAFFNNIGQKLKPFFYGKYYPAVVALVTAMLYHANLSLLGLGFFAFFATVQLLFFRDLTAFIPLPIFAVLVLPDFSVFNSFATFIVLSVPFIALVLHFIIYPIKKVFIGKVFFSLVAVSVALLLGGICSPHNVKYAYGLVTALTVGALMLFAYFLFTNYYCPPDDFDAGEYFCFMLLCLGGTLFFESLIPAVREANTFGWGSTNTSASLLLLSIPAGWYLVLYKKDVLLNLPLLVIQYVALVFAKSDACLGIVFVMTPVFLLVALIIGKVPKTKRFVLFTLLSLFAIALIVCGGILGYSEQARIWTADRLSLMLDDNGRSKFYKKAVEEFLHYPLFGVGQGYMNDEFRLTLTGVITFNFHSTFFHVLATMGTVGVLAYAYYYFSRIRAFTAENTAFSRFSFLAFIMLQAYGAVDTSEFNVVPIMMTLTLFMVVVEMTAKTKKPILPLWNNRLG